MKKITILTVVMLLAVWCKAQENTTVSHLDDLSHSNPLGTAFVVISGDTIAVWCKAQENTTISHLDDLSHSNPLVISGDTITLPSITYAPALTVCTHQWIITIKHELVYPAQYERECVKCHQRNFGTQCTDIIWHDNMFRIMP